MAEAVPARQLARPRNDQLMLLPEIAKYVRRSENTLRWLRNKGGPTAPPIWKQGRRLVAWKSEIDGWLDEQRQADHKAEERARCDLEVARTEDYIRRLVETAPPLQPEAIERIHALLFSPTTASGQENASDVV